MTTDPNDLERHILYPNIAKSEAEWWAKRRIEKLEKERDRALMESARNAACDDYFAARPQIDCIDRRRVYEAGFQAGAASRDAEVEKLKNDLSDALDCKTVNGPTALSKVIKERDQLRAQINVLRELLDEATTYTSSCAWSPSMTAEIHEAIASIPEQSISEF